MSNAILYLIISAVSFPFLAIYNACAALFRSMGNSGITLKVSILMNIVNVGGNAVCVFGLKMGVAGGGCAIADLQGSCRALSLYPVEKSGQPDSSEQRPLPV